MMNIIACSRGAHCYVEINKNEMNKHQVDVGASETLLQEFIWVTHLH